MAYENDEEQLEALRHFWERWGTVVLLVLALGLGGAGAWQWYGGQQSGKALEASVLYQQAIEAPEAAAANLAAERLRANYGGTRYAALGSLFQARRAVEAGDTDLAAQALQWVRDETDESILREFARLRLAQVRIAEQDFDTALALLADPVAAPLEAQRNELRGDVLLALDRAGDARDAYAEALGQTEQSARRDLLQMKLNAVDNS